MPFYIAITAKMFLSGTEVLTFVERKFDGNLNFPTLTVCHPLFFNLTKMKQFNMDNKMASYL
jgi:hypothetical protein